MSDLPQDTAPRLEHHAGILAQSAGEAPDAWLRPQSIGFGRVPLEPAEGPHPPVPHIVTEAAGLQDAFRPER